MKPRILFIIASDYDSLKKKGVLHLILERDEFGFFERVVTVHPVAPKTQVIQLNDVHIIYEIGLDLIPGSNKFCLLRYMQIPTYFVRVILKLVLLVKKEKIDLIRATDPYWMGLFAWFTHKLCKVPFCVSIHANYDKRFELNRNESSLVFLRSRKIMKMLERFILKRANLVMPIRESLKEWAIENGADSKKIRVILHGIDMMPFQNPLEINIHQYFSIPKEKKIISFVGRLAKENYVDDILTLARGMSSRNDFVFILVGGGQEEERLNRIIQEDRDLSSNVKLVGFQPQEIVFALRRTSAISLCLMGGFSLIEACAAARPVVSYDVEWHYELVKNNKTGFLVKEHNIDHLIEVISYLLDNPHEADMMGRNAQQIAFKQHDIKKTSVIKCEQYIELLRKVK